MPLPSAPADMDVGFVLICAALVFLMQAGFCMLESGMIRSKNSINVAVKNLLDFGISMLVFGAFGFSLMFGVSQAGLFGSTVEFWHNNELGAFFLYQMVFCGTAATIVSGAVAERTRLSTYLFIVLILSGVTYPLIGHWCWGGALDNTGSGWLARLGFVDWAGASVVHVTGAFAALAAILAIGPRRNYKQGKVRGGHSLTLAIMGCFLLWFGWWGFNGGSGLNAEGNVAIVLLNTNLGAVAGLLAAAAWSWFRGRKTDVIDLISGTLAGLVSVTGACHVISPIASIVAGAVGSLIALWSIEVLRKRGADDAVGAFGIHGVAGIWGTLVFALFAPLPELAAGGRMLQVLVQSLGAVVAAGFSFGTIYGSLQLLKRFQRLRVKAGEEKLGLNVVEHGATNEVSDLLTEMDAHRHTGNFETHLEIDTDTEVGQIASQYNAVISRVNSEVTDHRKTNLDLQAEKLRLQSVLENAGVGIYQLSETGHFQSANTTLLEILGHASTSDLIDEGNAFKLPWHHEDDSKMVAEGFDRGQAIKNLESEYVTRDGETRWLLESITPVRDEKGCLVTWLGTVHDVTTRKNAMLAEVQIAEAKSAAKGEFLANMSHEIRTPLNGVIGMLDLLSTSVLERKDENYVKIARSSADSLLALINDILDFSKIEAGKLELESVDFDLRELIEVTAEQFSIRAHLKGLEMNCELSADLPFMVTGDPERLRQSITNLLGNAIKFTDTGEINLRVSRRGSVIRFGVQDTGIGVSKGAQNNLFESFVQADVSTTRRYGGTGLGLSIVNQLVDLMGGKLKVDSVVGEGSEFWFELPLPVAVEESTDRDPTGIASDLSEFNVLIVDDNETNCEILVNQLANWGLQSSVCNRAPTVVNKMLVAQQLETPFDLVILDFCMPDMNGRDVALALQEQPGLRDVPIIMLSSNHDLLSQSELAEAGIGVAMTKPARQSRLYDAIVSILFEDHFVKQNQSNLPVAPAAEIVAPGPIERPSNAEKQPLLPNESPAEKPLGVRASNPSQVVPLPYIADVLIAEDNQINQLVVQQMLETQSYSTDLASDGEAAVRKVMNGRYGMILMDGHMPVMDGLTATKRIREWEAASGANKQGDGVPIVALTADVVAGIRQKCMDAGMNAYLCKPITLERLKEVTSSYLGIAAEDRHDSCSPSVVDEPQTQSSEPEPVPVSPAVFAPPTQQQLPTQAPTQQAPTLLEVNLLNEPELLNRCGGDLGFQTQILEIMRDCMPDRLVELKAAQQQDDLARIRSIAHQLKGAAGDTSLVAVEQAAGQLEHYAEQRDQKAAANAIADLEARINNTMLYLQKLLT